MTELSGNANNSLAVRFEDGAAKLIAGLGGRFGNHNRAEIPDLWQRFGPKFFGRVPGQVDKRSYGVCFNMDDKGNLDYLAGVEVSNSTAVPVELTQLSLAPSRYAVFEHAGHISTISRTWMNIFVNWAPTSGVALAPAPSFECYAEAFDPDIAIGNVAIWIPIKA